MTLAEALAEAAAELARAGVGSARLDARLLAAIALGCAPEEVPAMAGRPFGEDLRIRFEALLRRRRRREPMAHIRGEREFWSLPFRVTPAVLIPRPDSETVVEAALAWAKGCGRALTVLDLGTGSGCLLLSLLHELPEASGVGVDASPAALAVAGENARALGLESRCRLVSGNWGEALSGRFDVIVANPPYIVAGAIAGLEPEVAEHEPALALDGGADGLEAYRALLPGLARLLAPDGAAFLEIGAGQEEAVAALLAGHGLRLDRVHLDLAGIPRCLIAVRGC